MLDQSASASSAYPSLDLPCGRHVTLEFLLVTGLIDFTLVGFGGWVEHTSLRHLDRMNTITYVMNGVKGWTAKSGTLRSSEDIIFPSSASRDSETSGFDP